MNSGLPHSQAGPILQALEHMACPRAPHQRANTHQEAGSHTGALRSTLWHPNPACCVSVPWPHHQAFEKCRWLHCKSNTKYFIFISKTQVLQSLHDKHGVTPGVNAQSHCPFSSSPLPNSPSYSLTKGEKAGLGSIWGMSSDQRRQIGECHTSPRGLYSPEPFKPIIPGSHTIQPPHSWSGRGVLEVR